MLYLNVAAALIGALSLDAATAKPVELLAKRIVPDTHVLHERQEPHLANVWSKRDRLPSDFLLPMRIGLRQNNLDIGHTMLMERSTQDHVNYGKRMSSDEVIDFFAPSRESVEAVRDWLVANGIDINHISQSANKQWIQFDATTEEAEALLHTDYFEWEHGHSGSTDIAAEDYHIPVEIREHIDYITPGIRLRKNPVLVKKAKTEQKKRHDGVVRRHESRAVMPMYTVQKDKSLAATLPPLNLTVCQNYVTQECIFKQYKITPGTLAAEGNELGIFESLSDHYGQNDLDVYFSTLFPAIPNGTYPENRLIDGAIGPAPVLADAGVESDLDFESSWPIIWPQKTVLFQTDDEYYQVNETASDTLIKGFWNTFYDALDGSYCSYSAFGETGNCVLPECLDPVYPDLANATGAYKGQLQCGVYKPTNVISISYGGGEADTPAYYVKRQCSEIMKLGLQGITVVISSGDDGVGSFQGDPSPTGCGGPKENIFYPANDATCPYVLAVGSTEFDKTSNSTNSTCYYERSTARFPSGGGFSNVFPTADYQTQQVATYFDSVTLGFSGYTDPGTNFSTVGNGVYKIGGRGYPDVSAIGDNFITRFEGTWGRVGGTSLAAPVWAGILTRVNEERIAIGKGSIGFVNPILYAHPEVFTDVVLGSNPNCGTTGFLAAKGWDPVSGLGTPRYDKLLALLIAQP